MNQIQRPISVLIIGGPQSGKTHYGGQLLKRLRTSVGKVVMNGVPDNIAPFENVLARLEQGVTSEHTPTDNYLESIWPILLASGQTADLIWPDYGGEQIKHILLTRKVPNQWVERIQNSDAWILFIRLHHVRIDDDIIMRQRIPIDMKLRTPAQESNTDKSQSPYLISQADLIELMQIFLFTKKSGLVKRIKIPAISIALSCWDEMEPELTDLNPTGALKKCLPLFWSFVGSNWEPSALSILGISSLGKPLTKDVPDDSYVDLGPEKHGWIITEKGDQDSDLTEPLNEIMMRITK